MKLRIVALLLTGVSTGIGCSCLLSLSGNDAETPIRNHPTLLGNPLTHSLTFDASSRLNEEEASSLPRETIRNTSSGNPLYFTYQNVGVAGVGAFQTIEAGGYIQNSFKHELEFDNRISGISGIDYDASSTGLKAYFGVRYSDGILWDMSTALDGSNDGKYALGGGSTREYFKIVNESGSAITLNSLTLSYSCVAREDEIGELLTYSNNVITGATVSNASAIDVVIPSSHEGYAITEIGNSAFNGYTKLWNCYIPDGFRTIKGSAFNTCTGLKYLYVPIEVDDIYGGAFTSSNIKLYAARASDAKPSWRTGWNGGLSGVVYNATRYNLPIA